jgi:hypothetical protein
MVCHPVTLQVIPATDAVRDVARSVMESPTAMNVETAGHV